MGVPQESFALNAPYQKFKSEMMKYGIRAQFIDRDLRGAARKKPLVFEETMYSGYYLNPYEICKHPLDNFALSFKTPYAFSHGKLLRNRTVYFLEVESRIAKNKKERDYLNNIEIENCNSFKPKNFDDLLDNKFEFFKRPFFTTVNGHVFKIYRFLEVDDFLSSEPSILKKFTLHNLDLFKDGLKQINY